MTLTRHGLRQSLFGERGYRYYDFCRNEGIRERARKLDFL